MASTLFAAPGIAPTPPLPPDQQRAKFLLPPGFEIQLVVAEPDIGQPMNLNFDARGRLWVTHSIEYPYPAKGDVEPRSRFPGQGDHEPRDRLSVLKIGSNGRASKVTHFANGLNIPIGNTPLADGETALVYSIPNIYQATDSNGDGIADRREVLYGKFGNVDTHGMVSSLTRWIDGWVYGCHGFANTSEVRDAKNKLTTMNSGNTYRFREDGSRFEQFTWGQVNPFGLAFDPWGNAFDSDCHSMPIYMLLRGGYYPSFGKPHDGLGFAPTMIDHGHGSTGICGPAFYAADHFPMAYRDNIFICNPVNCQVHRDRLKQVGSTFLIDTQPDFITCDDGWFRPVDAAVGPDGALYIADFYNCIIGHYEVPLEHPRRDRRHGRIWRVVYTGTDGKAEPPRLMPDLTRLETDGVVELLADPNLIVRTLATNQLFDRATPAQRNGIVSSVREAMEKPDAPPTLRAHGLWVRERLDDLSTDDIRALAADESPLVRTHLLRALAEREKWTETESTLVRAALDDENAIVRRVAADALGRHPDAGNIEPLFALFHATPPEDTHLVHVARMALRDQLRDNATLAAVRQMALDRPSRKLLADAALSVKTASSAEFLLDFLADGSDDPRQTDSSHVEYVAFAAEYLETEGLEKLAAMIRKQHASDLPFQISQLKAIHAGFARRGVANNRQVTAWANELAVQLLDLPKSTSVPWQSIPSTNSNVPGDPWVRQERRCADGKDATFWSSLPRGERLTGTLKSGEFDVPAKLGFFIAGHNGPTGQPETPRNFIRLRDAETGTLLVEATPPRNDVAQHVEWDLAKFAGQRAVIDLVDEFDATGFAWLAVGRFSLDELNLDRFRPRPAGLELVALFRLHDLRPRVENLVRSPNEDIATRSLAAESLLAFVPDARVAAILSAVSEASPATLNEQILQAALTRDEKGILDSLAEVMSREPRAPQRKLAEMLCGDRAGGEALLQLAADGKASPRLLLDATLRAGLDALKLNALEKRIATITAGLPSENEALLALLEQRRRQYASARPSAEEGARIYQKHCSACHQLGGKGAKVGPQLDGVGGRGLARLIEDVLDPNRNVDPAFRTKTFSLSNGKVVSGLVRRTEGQTVILADNQGKEITVAQSEIEEQSQTTLSLMPANFAESLRDDEFQHLLAFLLSQRESPKE